MLHVPKNWRDYEYLNENQQTVNIFTLRDKNSLCFCGMLLYRKILNIMQLQREVIALGLIVLYFLPVTFLTIDKKSSGEIV